MKHNITFTEWKTGDKTTNHLSPKGLELCDYLARNGGLCLVEEKGYFYNFEDFKNSLKKLTASNQWEYFKNY